MKKTIKVEAVQRTAAMRSIAGIIAIVAVIGLSMTACATGDSGGNTTISVNSSKFDGYWKGTDNRGRTFGFIFYGDAVTIYSSGDWRELYKFTYTDTTITFIDHKNTHWGGPKEDEWTQGYILTDSYLELLESTDGPYWFGRLEKD